MGQLEQRNRQKIKQGQLQKIVLSSVVIAGSLSIALVAPNVLGAMHKLKLIPAKRQKESIKNARRALVKKGLLREQRGYIIITKKGEKELERFQLFELTKKKPKKWDKKWRLLIFDIPEQKKNYRNRVRITLKEIGFVRLQDSVWVYPYNCEDFVTLLKTDFKLGRELLYVIADDIEADTKLKKIFNLK